MNFLFSWLFLKLGFSPEVIFYVKIALALLTLCVRMFYAKRQAGFSILFFTRFVLLPVSAVAGCVSLLQLGLRGFVDTWPERILVTVAMETVLVLVIWLAGLSKTERQSLRTLCYTKLKR